jgi:hypothetical protein
MIVHGSLDARAPGNNPVIAVAAGGRTGLFAAIVSAMSTGICAPFDASQSATEIDAFFADVKPSAS